MKPLLTHVNRHGLKPVLLTIHRDEIEQLNLKPALQMVQAMTATPTLVAYNAGTLSLSVDGYAAGERATPENRALIRRYFTMLDRQFNGWFHLCNRWDTSLQMLFLSMTSLKQSSATDSGRPGLRFDANDLQLFITVHNMSLARIHMQNGISYRTTMHVKRLMQAYFDNCFVSLKQEK